jgi:hypothetical protein
LGDDAYDAAAPQAMELDLARGFREKSVVSAKPDVETWMDLGSALAHDDGSCTNLLTTKSLHSQSLGL